MPKNDNKPEKIPAKTETTKRVRSNYPTGSKMKKGSKLECLACKGRNSACKGCEGKGYIIV